MFDTVLTALAAWHVLAALFGLAVLRVGRTRPRTAAGGVGVVVAGGLGLVWYGADAAGTDFDTWQPWYAVGLGVVIAGLPAGLLIPSARDPRAATLGGQAHLIGGYLAACWGVAVALGVLAFLTIPPPGGFR